jgi:tripeptide aminopeptidase
MSIPGASGSESEVAEHVRSLLLQAGADSSLIFMDDAHKRTPLKGNCGNLILRLPGKRSRPRRLLMAHLDTVPACVGARPVLKGGQIVSSRPDAAIGADNRAGVAVILSAALRLLKEQPSEAPPVTFLWTVQEEIGLQGARCLRHALLGRPKLAFNWDGGGPHNVTLGATGGYRMSIDILGRASHAGNAPEQGISAIAIASLAIASLHERGWHGRIERNGKLGTSNVGVIRGGDATNVVTDFVEIRAEARSHDPGFRQQIVKEIESAFRAAAARIQNTDGQSGDIRFSGTLDYEAFRLPRHEPAVLAAQRAIESNGGTAEPRIANGGLDANWMTARGIPTVTMGCGQRNAHMLSEALVVNEFLQACDISWTLASGSESSHDAT